MKILPHVAGNSGMAHTKSPGSGYTCLWAIGKTICFLILLFRDVEAQIFGAKFLHIKTLFLKKKGDCPNLWNCKESDWKNVEAN